MALTEQSNATLEDISRVLSREENRTVALCGHVSPDGDCLGSVLALGHALRLLGKDVACLLAKDEAVELGLSFIPGAGALAPACSYVGESDVFVACDVPNLQRLGDAAAVHARAKTTITVDHHASPTTVSDLNYVDPDAPATALIVWDLVKAMGLSPTADIAACAYTGLMTDTGGFQFQNTTVGCFAAASEMVACGADPASIARDSFQNRSVSSLMLERRMLERAEFDLDRGFAISCLSQEDFLEAGADRHDAEPLINVLRSVAGVEVAAILRDQGDVVRGSLRAKDDTDVSAIAREFGGGGHVAAAGFTYEGSLPEAVSDVKRALIEAREGR